MLQPNRQTNNMIHLRYTSYQSIFHLTLLILGGGEGGGIGEGGPEDDDGSSDEDDEGPRSSQQCVQS